MSATTLPRPTRPPRLAPLAKLPVFFDLSDRRVLLIGGGEPAVWKAELLLAAGAELTVVAEDAHPDLVKMADGTAPSPTRTRPDPSPAGEGSSAGHLRGSASFRRRPWDDLDLEGVALVVADIADPAEAGRLAAACRARGVPLNVIDEPAFCDFQFGTVVNRSPVVIGIMTDGAAPILGQAIRRRIEAVLPAALSGWAAAAKGFRDRLKALVPERAERRVFWERFVDAAFAAGAPPAPGELERMADGLGGAGLRGRVGSVAIVGAGPGDPELLTLKAMRELQAADVIVYDRLVTPAVLELGRREARRVHVGKEGHGAACRQEDISALLVDLALAGERVVRLKGGDPAVFGRTGEETEACRAAGVPVRIVPGITSASAAAASLGLSLTHRDHAQRLQLVTGHDRRGALPADLDLAGLADPRATLVVYMGRRTGPVLARELAARGLPGETPVRAVIDASRPTEEQVATDLAGLAAGLDLPASRPVVLLIGAALGRSGVAAAAVASEEPARRHRRRDATDALSHGSATPRSR